MKLTLLTLALPFVFCLSCSTRQSESAQNDSTVVKNTTTDTVLVESSEGDGDMAEGGAVAYQLQKNELAAIMADFNAIKESSQKIVFEASYDLGGHTTTCHFLNGKLKFFHKYEGAEGGFEENTLMKTEPGYESVVRTGSETQGFFKWVDKGNTEWYKVSVNPETNTPEIQEASDPIDYAAEALLNELLTKIIDNKDKFTLVNGQYEWYQRKEKVNSEYGGEMEVYEVFRIDPKLFNLDFKRVFP
jgi:hypothetical protein